MRIAPVSTWFARKRFGWGWTLASPEGWAVIAISVLIICALAA